MAATKRKADSEDGLQPRKKSTTQAPVRELSIQLVPKPTEPGLIIAKTPGFILPRNIHFQPFQKPARRSSDDARGQSRDLPVRSTAPAELLLQSSSHPRLDYTAREEQDGSAERHLKHYLAVVDPASRELKLIEARKLVVRGVPCFEHEEEAEDNNKAKPTYTTLRQELGMAFGTKKAKKALASMTENAISPQKTPGLTSAAEHSLAAAVLESMAAYTGSTPSKEALQAHIDESKPRPKANLAATTPDEVYPLESLIKRDELDALEVAEWIDAAKAKEQIQTHSRFVSRRIQSLAVRDEVRKLKVLKYILLLVEWFLALRTTKYGGRKIPPKEELLKKTRASSFLLDSVRRKFTSSGELTKWDVDKLSMHIAALTLIVDDYETDVFDLREDLRLESRQIIQYFSELGCRVEAPTEAERSKRKIVRAEAAAHKIAKLKLPLQFPKARMMPSRRR